MLKGIFVVDVNIFISFDDDNNIQFIRVVYFKGKMKIQR